MIYTTFQDKKLSLLGFGAMRLPVLADGSIDEPQVERMTRYAMEHGVNYYDTAWPYHSGESERVMGRILSKYPRDSYYLADKYPGLSPYAYCGWNPVKLVDPDGEEIAMNDDGWNVNHKEKTIHRIVNSFNLLNYQINRYQKNL